MTIAKAINDIAAAQGGTPARPATIAGAIDALNDALAGSDQKAARTIEDAVVLLGEHIGGGGGGADLGELYKPYFWFADVPSIGDAWVDEYLVGLVVSSLGVGSTPLFDAAFEDSYDTEPPGIAGGATVKTVWFPSGEAAGFDSVYTVTVKDDGRSEKVGAIVNLNVTATTETETVEGETGTRYVFTLPPKPVAADIPLEEGESIYGVYNIIHIVAASEG